MRFQPGDNAGTSQPAVPGDAEFAQLLIDTYVRFPKLPKALAS